MKIKEILNEENWALESINVVQFKNPIETEQMEEIVAAIKENSSRAAEARGYMMTYEIVDNTKIKYSIYAPDDTVSSEDGLYELNRNAAEVAYQVITDRNLKDNLQYIVVDYESHDMQLH